MRLKLVLSIALLAILVTHDAAAFLPLTPGTIIIQNQNTFTSSNQGTYNQTYADNILKNSGGYRFNFINGTNNPITVINDPTRSQVNVTISSTGGGGGITTLNGDPTGAQTINVNSGQLTINNTGATHTLGLAIKVNNITCSSQFISTFNNATGLFTCATPIDTNTAQIKNADGATIGLFGTRTNATQNTIKTLSKTGCITLSDNGTNIQIGCTTGGVNSLNFTTSSDFDFNILPRNMSWVTLDGTVFNFHLKPSLVSTNGTMQSITKVLNLTNYLDTTAIGSTPATPPPNIVRIYTDMYHGKATLNFVTPDGSDVRLARDNYIIAKNSGVSDIPAGKAVYITGSGGQVPQIALAKADSFSTMPAIGITDETITSLGGFGRVTILGLITNIDTSAFNEGDRLFVSPTTAGNLTVTEPTYPNLDQRIAYVTNKNAVTGSLLVLIGSIQSVTANTAQGLNLGTSGTGIYSSNFNATQLQFLKLISANSNCVFSSNSTNVILTCTGSGTDIDPAPKVVINGNNRTSFISVANTTSSNSINGHLVSFPSSNTGTILLGNGSLSSLTGTLAAALGVTTLSNSGHVSTFPSTTGTLCQANQTTTCGAAFNDNDPAPKISINGNNRSSFVSVANTTSTNTINGHLVSFPSNATGTLCLRNQTGSCGTSAGGGITSINGDTTAAQKIVRDAAGNMTITNSTGQVKIGLGTNVVTTNGALQNVTKGLQIMGISGKYIKTTIGYTPKATDDFIEADTTSSSFAVTLPSAVTMGKGKLYVIENTGISAAQKLQILTTGGQTVDGGTNINMTYAGQALGVVSDGTNWRVFKNLDTSWDAFYMKGSTTAWYGNTMSALAPTTQISVVTTLRASPWILSHTITIDKIQAEISTAANPTSTTCRIGIYRDNGQVYPQALVTGSDVGTFTTTAAVKTNTFASPITLQEGLYWMAYTCGTAATTQPTWRALSAGSIPPVLGAVSTMGANNFGTAYTVAFTFAAMPATFPAGATILTGATFPAEILVEVQKG